MRYAMPRKKRIQDDPILTLRTDSNGKPTEKSISDLFSLFDMQELFGHKKTTTESNEKTDNNKTIDKN